MKTMFMILAGVCFLSILSTASAQMRAWTNSKGISITAKLVSHNTETGTVTLRKNNGKTYTIAVSTLSKADRDFIAKWQETQKQKSKHSIPLHKRLYPRTKEEIATDLEEIRGRKAPKGIAADSFEAVTELNIYRYLCGLPHKVVCDQKKEGEALLAAEACKKAGQMAHNLGAFTEVCNLSAVGSKKGSVADYIRDPGTSNRPDRAHRRWCLNPLLKKTGFGLAAPYSAMWVSGPMKGNGLDSWSYPGKGFFPANYLLGNSWSIYLDGKNPNKEKVEVEVYKLAERPAKPLSAKTIPNGRPLKVQFLNIFKNAINFEIDYEGEKKGIYWVKVRGDRIRISYLVELY